VRSNTHHDGQARTVLRCPVCTEAKHSPDEVVRCMLGHQIELQRVLTRLVAVGVLDNDDVDRWLSEGGADVEKSGGEKTPQRP